MQHLFSIALMLVIACTTPEPGITADIPEEAPEETAIVEEVQETNEEAPEMHEEPADMEYLGSYTITEYNYCEGGGENYTTAGGYEPVPWWTCAAPYDIEMGTVIYVDGLGEFQVQDRGGFSGDIIDVHTGYDVGQIGSIQRDVYIVHK